MNRFLNIYHMVLLSFLAQALPAQAVIKDWIEFPDNHLWSIQERWSPIGVPTIADDVRIGLVPIIDLEIDAVYATANASTLAISGGAELHAESGVNIQHSLSIVSNLGSDPRASGLRLFFASDMTVGAPSVPGDPSIELIGGSLLHLSEWADVLDFIDVSAAGPVVVDSLSKISGRGTLHLGEGINLNGTLRTGANESFLTLTDTALVPDALLWDIDGSSDTGILDLSSPDTILELPSLMSDAFSGNIILGSGSSLHFSGTETVVIDGHIQMIGDLVSTPEAQAPAIIQAPNLLFDEDSEYGDIVSPRSLTLDADSVNIKGFFNITYSVLTVNTITPWRLEGELQSNGGQAFLNGSPLVVGSSTGGAAFIDAQESFVFNIPVTLESTATVTAGVAAAASSLTFNDDLTLQGPDINALFGPWVDGAPINPAPVGLYGDVFVENSSTIYSGYTRLGELASIIPITYEIFEDQVFILDTSRVLTESTVQVNISNNAEFELIVRDPVHSPWVNNMDISLTNATFTTAEVCNQGSITGTGTINAMFVAFDSGMIPCAGSIAPGLSPGKLTINGNADFNETEFIMEIESASVGEFDELAVNGDLSINAGTLSLEFLDGFAPSNGESFQLFSATGTMLLNFSSIEVSGLPDGYALDEDELLNSGVAEFTSSKKHRPCKHRRSKHCYCRKHYNSHHKHLHRHKYCRMKFKRHH